MRWDFRAEDGETPRESFDTFRDRYVRVVGEELRSGRLTYWVAEEDAVLIAHMAIFRMAGIPRPARPSDQWGYLTDCYTRPAFRGAHIGSALLQHVQDWARRQDFELLLVAPSETAERFYHRAGFHDATTFRQCRFRPFDGEELPTDGSPPRAI